MFYLMIVWYWWFMGAMWNSGWWYPTYWAIACCQKKPLDICLTSPVLKGIYYKVLNVLNLMFTNKQLQHNKCLGLKCLTWKLTSTNTLLYTARNIHEIWLCLFQGEHSLYFRAKTRASGYRCVSDCRPRGHEFDPDPVHMLRCRIDGTTESVMVAYTHKCAKV